MGLSTGHRTTSRSRRGACSNHVSFLSSVLWHLSPFPRFSCQSARQALSSGCLNPSLRFEATMYFRGRLMSTADSGRLAVTEKSENEPNNNPPRALHPPIVVHGDVVSLRWSAGISCLSARRGAASSSPLVCSSQSPSVGVPIPQMKSFAGDEYDDVAAASAAGFGQYSCKNM